MLALHRYESWMMQYNLLSCLSPLCRTPATFTCRHDMHKVAGQVVADHTGTSCFCSAATAFYFEFTFFSGLAVKSSLKEVSRTGMAGSSNDVGTSMRYETKCPSGAFVTEIKGWSSNVLDGLQLLCSDGTVLRPVGGNQTGSPVTATSSQGFTRVTMYVTLEGQNMSELEILPFNVTRVVGLTALDSSGATTSWGVSSSTVGVFNESILSCDDVSGGGRITAMFGSMLVNLTVPSKSTLESLGVACGGIRRCEYSWTSSKPDMAAHWLVVTVA